MSQTAQCGTAANVGIDTELIFHPKTDREMKLPGINNAQIPGWTTELITDDAFDHEIAGTILGSLSYEPAQFSTYMRSKNPAQEEIRIMSRDRTAFNDLHIVYNKKAGHFWALDLASDPCGECGISGYMPQAYGRNDLQQVQFTLTVNGSSAMYEYHTPALAYDIEDGVLTATGADFVSLGFRAGMTVIIETGAPESPFIYGLITAATATTITLKDTSVTQASLSGAIHGAVIALAEAV